MSTARLEIQLVPPTWASITDMVTAEPVRARRGQASAASPINRVADPGVFTFALRNDATNSGSKLGYYSPLHANIRAGFVKGAPTRLVINDGSDHVVWTGVLRVIDPAPGVKLSRKTYCTAHDTFAAFTDAQVRKVDPQINKTEVDLLQEILAALPTESQPPATSYDSPLDVYPYAFDQVGAGGSAIGLINDVAVSAFGWVYPTAAGTFTYENRHTRSVKTFATSFGDTTLGNAFVVPTSLANVYNRINVLIHPKTTVPSVVLYSAPGPTTVAPGQTVTFWGTYSDNANNNETRLIGGTDFVAPVATTDYLGNTLSDGTGSDQTSSLTVTATPFASAVKFDISTSAMVTVYVTFLQLRGTGIYDNAPPTIESFVAKSYGDRPIDIDLKFQNDATVAKDLADYVQVLYDEANNPEAVQIKPLKSAALMTQAVTREIGDVIRLSETVTGVTTIDVAIVGIEWEMLNGKDWTVTWSLAPQSAAHPFILDDSIYGVLDTGPGVLGYA